MKKFVILPCVFLFIVGCSSNQSKDKLLIETAMACSVICDENPSINKVSTAAGAGIPILFMGGMESTCDCAR